MKILKSKIYTQAEIDLALEDYSNGIKVEEIAIKLDKSTKSVVAKLSQLGVYQARPKRVARPKKEELIEALAKTLEIDINQLQSLGGATHETLQLLVNTVAKRTDYILED